MIIYQFSYICPEEDLKEIMAKAKITYERKTIHLILDYNNLPKRRNREGEFHRALKGAIANYLKIIGEPNPLLEYGYLDVYAPKLGVIVECGDTPVSRIVDNLKYREGVKELWTVDFNCERNVYELIIFKNA